MRHNSGHGSTSVFFTGVPVFMTEEALKPHFESVGRIVDFRLLGPAPGRDFRYGEVDYTDEKTAQEAIQRLNGHAFGSDRPMRVSPVDSRFRKRPRTGDHGGSGSKGTTDARGRELMQFPRDFFDPVLGREDSPVLEALRSMATEDAYEAVEQLRVLVMTRKEDARALIEENPALAAAVVMILQHSNRLPGGPLPPEAFEEEGASETTIKASAQHSSSTSDGMANPSTGATTEAKTPEVRPTLITDEQRKQAIASIKKMRDEDVQRILALSSEDIAKVRNPAQRKQLEILHRCLVDMTSGL